jgi:hypothetical protein
MEQPPAFRPDRRSAPLTDRPDRRARAAHDGVLELVIQGVAEQDHRRPRLPRRLSDQPVTGRPGRRGDPCDGFVSAPRQPPEGNAETGRHRLRPVRPGAALGLKPMIDMQGQQRTPSLTGEGARDQQ